MERMGRSGYVVAGREQSLRRVQTLHHAPKRRYLPRAFMPYAFTLEIEWDPPAKTDSDSESSFGNVDQVDGGEDNQEDEEEEEEGEEEGEAEEEDDEEEEEEEDEEEEEEEDEHPDAAEVIAQLIAEFE